MTRPQTHLIVDAGVRYWEDAMINGQEDTGGHLIPFRKGGRWQPIIGLATGKVVDWPAGTVADVHYKVCDDGEYWLGDAGGTKAAKWTGDYVPDNFLSVGSRGYGDYIIMNIGADGVIQGWLEPTVDAKQWEDLK